MILNLKLALEAARREVLLARGENERDRKAPPVQKLPTSRQVVSSRQESTNLREAIAEVQLSLKTQRDEDLGNQTIGFQGR
ncbi:MAG: hypothetical protein WD767_13920 [Alphaproteobacteria bacterium]